MKFEVIKSDAPRPLAHYSEGTKVGPWFFAAGQIASDYKTGVPPEARKEPTISLLQFGHQTSDPLRA